MKNFNIKLLGLVIIIAHISACSVFKNTAPVYEIDPVCHMKVDKAEAFKWKYNGVEYYFDNINCEETFKMDPENILKKNNCDPKK
jgi:YHS domain-containing protein